MTNKQELKTMAQTIEFNQILEIIDTLSRDEQEDLINIVRHRQIEKRREEIANNIKQAKQDYQNGMVFRGTIDDILTELNND
jgi:hypothetical protein